MKNNGKKRFPKFTFMPLHLSCVYETAGDLIIPDNLKKRKYYALANLIKEASKNNELSYPLAGLNHSGINDKQVGVVNINYTQMENLAVLYGVPTGVMLIISRAMAEIQDGNLENLQAFIKGLLQLINAIEEEENQLYKKNKNSEQSRRTKLATDFLNAYKECGLSGKGPDFCKS